MTPEPLPAALRRDRIAALVQDRGFIRVAELSRIFRTSPVTIRTDLDDLVERALVRRVHGGAVPTTPRPNASPAAEPDPRHGDRAAIAAAAAERVRPGETVVIGSSVMTRAVGHALAARDDLEDVLVVTSDLQVALELQPRVPRITVLVMGGTLRRDVPELGDPFAGAVLEDVSADLVILGCWGVSAARGLTADDLGSVNLTRRLLEVADRRLVVADAPQVGAAGTARVAPIHDLNVLITGPDADEPELARLRELGLEVQVVG